MFGGGGTTVVYFLFLHSTEKKSISERTQIDKFLLCQQVVNCRL